jgi:hypothetical protein
MEIPKLTGQEQRILAMLCAGKIQRKSVRSAGLRMAEFVITYGEYLENPDERKIILW